MEIGSARCGTASARTPGTVHRRESDAGWGFCGTGRPRTSKRGAVIACAKFLPFSRRIAHRPREWNCCCLCKPEQSARWRFSMNDTPTWRPACRREKCSFFHSSRQSPWVPPRGRKVAAVAAVAEVAEVAEREVVAPVALVVERQAVPVALVEQQAQPAAQRPARPTRVQRQAAA